MASLPPPVVLPDFAGPLDLLLDEVRRQKVAIENIAMAPIVSRFLEYIGAAAERNLNLDIEWLHMAATLIHWKSLSLLPHAADGVSASDPIRDELIRQLLAHGKEAAGELAARRALEDTRFTRPAGDSSPVVDEPAEAGFVSVWDLIQQARDLTRWVEEHRKDRQQWRELFVVDEDDVTVGEMMNYLRDQLAAGQGCLDATGLLQSQETLSRRSCLFLGMLEMARVGQVELQQPKPFGSIHLSMVRCS